MIEKLYELGIDLKGRTSGQVKVVCPKCSHTRKKKNDTCLSVNINTGSYNCHNSCGFSGSVGYTEKMEKKVYKVPVINNTQLSDKTLDWFVSNRKVSKSTVMRFGLTESMEWMPQVEKEMNCINFNYFRDEKLVNIKFRDGKKNFKMAKDAELVFYNLDSIKDSEEAIICEGEIDCMSFYESGLYNVVSVPNGASKGSQRLEYLDNCWKYFEGKKKIIIATDGDEPGIMLRDELARRLGKERCWIFQYPDECKDANEILVKAGPEVLKKCMDYIIEFPLEGITSISDIEDRINNIYKNGYPKGHRIGFNSLDEFITWRTGEFTAVTGIPGSGKSEFIDQVTLKLSVLHDWKWAVFSAENQPEELHFAKLSEKYIGKSFYSTNSEYKMDTEELYKSKVFVNDHFFFVNINEINVTLDGLLAKARELILRKGINGFLIDPWNYIEHKIPHGYTETQYISEALTKISRFCKVNNIHIIVVAHPTKIQKEDGKYRVATMYDIAGSAHWFNKIDNGMSVYRDFETGLVDVHIQKIRFKFIGQIGKASFTWDKYTGKYSEAGQKQIPEYFNS
jgi:twinkle protein